MKQDQIKPFKLSESTFSAMNEDSGGFCTKCRAEAYGVEPDAREYDCETCGAPAVYGVEELLIMGLVVLK